MGGGHACFWGSMGGHSLRGEGGGKALLHCGGSRTDAHVHVHSLCAYKNTFMVLIAYTCELGVRFVPPNLIFLYLLTRFSIN